jgi:hypothetical protein
MKKLKTFIGLLLLLGSTIFWTNCNISTISISNQTGLPIDSVKIDFISDSKYSFILYNIAPSQQVSKHISSGSDYKKGHYLFLNSTFFMKDSVIKGPDMSTDIFYGDEKYIYIVTTNKILLK